MKIPIAYGLSTTIGQAYASIGIGGYMDSEVEPVVDLCSFRVDPTVGAVEAGFGMDDVANWLGPDFVDLTVHFSKQFSP